MSKFVRLLLVLGLLGSGIVAMPAQALVYSDCRRTFTAAPASCVFTPVGPELIVGGNSGVPGGAGITVRITDPTGNVTFLQCHGSSNCSARILASTPTDSIGPPAGIGPLLCQVIAGQSGQFACASRS